MAFGISSYKRREMYVFRWTAPCRLAYETTNAMIFTCLDRELEGFAAGCWLAYLTGLYAGQVSIVFTMICISTPKLRKRCLLSRHGYNTIQLPLFWAEAMTKNVWSACKLSTLKQKLHGVWQGLFWKLPAHICLCRIEQELQGKCAFKLEAPRK